MIYCEYDCAAFDRWLWNKHSFIRKKTCATFWKKYLQPDGRKLEILRSIQTSIVAAQAYFNWNEGRRLAKHNKKKELFCLEVKVFENKIFYDFDTWNKIWNDTK